MFPPIPTIEESDCKGAPTNTSEEYQGTIHLREHPPSNSTGRREFERIANPSYEPLEMCREKLTYSNL